MKYKFIIFSVAVFAVGVISYFSFKNNTDTPAEAPFGTGQSIIQLVDGRQCYTYSHDSTVEEPYNVAEFIDITIKGTEVVGTKRGVQNGLNMTNGYTGTIVGTLENNAITDVYSYVIEGSKDKEKEIYQAGLTGIEKLRYPLVEGKGMLVLDTTKDFKIMNYARVGCKESN